MAGGEVTPLVWSRVKKASLLMLNFTVRSDSALLSQKSTLALSISTFVCCRFLIVCAIINE